MKNLESCKPCPILRGQKQSFHFTITHALWLGDHQTLGYFDDIRQAEFVKIAVKSFWLTKKAQSLLRKWDSLATVEKMKDEI